MVCYQYPGHVSFSSYTVYKFNVRQHKRVEMIVPCNLSTNLVLHELEFILPKRFNPEGVGFIAALASIVVILNI